MRAKKKFQTRTDQRESQELWKSEILIPHKVYFIKELHVKGENKWPNEYL